MPALAPVAPEVLLKILKQASYIVIAEDEFNWSIARGDADAPLIIPKRGKLVSVEIMMDALDKAKMDNATYFDFLAKAQDKKAVAN